MTSLGSNQRPIIIDDGTPATNDSRDLIVINDDDSETITIDSDSETVTSNDNSSDTADGHEILAARPAAARPVATEPRNHDLVTPTEDTNRPGYSATATPHREDSGVTGQNKDNGGLGTHLGEIITAFKTFQTTHNFGGLAREHAENIATELLNFQDFLRWQGNDPVYLQPIAEMEKPQRSGGERRAADIDAHRRLLTCEKCVD